MTAGVVIKDNGLHYAGDIEERGSGVGAPLTPDIESVEGVGAVRAVLEEIFLGLGKFLTGLVFAEPEASTLYARGLDGKDKVIIVLAVEKWGEAIPSAESEVYEVVFLIVPHGVAKVDGDDSPSMEGELTCYRAPEVDIVDGVV